MAGFSFKWPRIMAGLPVLWQVVSLTVFVLLAALTINTLVVIFMPAPKPSGYTINDAVAALKTGAVKLRNGRTLKAETLSHPPEFIARAKDPRDPRSQGFETFLRARLAHSLGVKDADLFVEARPSWRGQSRYPSDRPRLNDTPSDGRSGPPNDGEKTGFLLQNLPPNFNEQITFPPFKAALKLSDGRYRTLVLPKRWLEPWQINLLIGFGLTALLIIPVAYLLSRRLTKPIMALAQGAEQLGFDASAPPLKESGPAEVRAATHVLNAMQVRIRKHVESRTAVIAAIAHDLKTPLARLRLRIESLPAKDRDKIAQDIAHMDSLIRSALSFASTERMAQDITRLDISALSESLAEDLSDLYQVEIGEVTPRLTVMGDAVALKRVLSNLMENACRYAGGSRLSLRREADMAIITLSDTGPGIPDADLETVFEPFHRLESSRNRDTGGAGLGLSVARALAEAHKGTLSLHNRHQEHQIVGLDAVLKLPLAE